MDFSIIYQDNQYSSTLLSLYCNKEKTDRFLVANLVSWDDEFLLLSLLSPVSLGCRFDGLCLCSVKQIFRVEVDSQYLLDIKSQMLPFEMEISKMPPWEHFLITAQKSKTVVQFRNLAGKRIMFGTPITHSDRSVTIRRIYSDGTYGKIYQIDRNKIGMMVYASETEQKIAKQMKRL